MRDRETEKEGGKGKRKGKETEGKRETGNERAREILRKCGGGGMPVECK